MKSINSILEKEISDFLFSFNQGIIDKSQIVLQETKSEFEGDTTLVLFPLKKILNIDLNEIGRKIGEHLIENNKKRKDSKLIIIDYNITGGFLNLVIDINFFVQSIRKMKFSQRDVSSTKPILVEFASPNTNKPLHLGHIRNILLGDSLCRILAHNGTEVLRLCLYNDRGIHICKSMLAWKKFGNGETPESSGLKGDHLIGKYYVVFDQKNREQAEPLIAAGIEKDAAVLQTELTREAQEMLRLWEEGDEDTVALWKKMNDWVYGGFNETFRRLGVHFNHLYFESQTYLLGKSIVQEGLEKGVFYQKEDGSVWIDLTADGLDHKLVLRADGTSVYITQDIGTATERFNTFDAQACVYVVGNEQDYHFKVLKLIMKHLGRPWADQLHHFSYGMIELPSGKMKSREGTVVDADDLMDLMEKTAKDIFLNMDKTRNLDKKKLEKLYKAVGLGAMKYFLLKVEPKKMMLFNPEESIDFLGNTGPFIQYTHARISSILRKYDKDRPDKSLSKYSVSLRHNWDVELNYEYDEKRLIKLLAKFWDVIEKASINYSPAVIANYTYEVAKCFNSFYQSHSVLNNNEVKISRRRIQILKTTKEVLKTTLDLLGIKAPQQM